MRNTYLWVVLCFVVIYCVTLVQKYSNGILHFRIGTFQFSELKDPTAAPVVQVQHKIETADNEMPSKLVDKNAGTEGLPKYSLDQVHTYLTTKNTKLIEASARHAKNLFEQAKQASEEDRDVIYGKLHSPVLSYLLPKAGSTTLSQYVSVAMAASGGVSSKLCHRKQNDYSCMHDRNDTGCSVAFVGHIRPQLMAKLIVHAEQKQSGCQRWPSNPLNATSEYDSFREVHERSVCVLPFREPVDRALSGFYEWTYQITTNLTAFEYLEQHGREGYLKIINQWNEDFEYGWVKSEELWPIVLENCFVGVTDNYDEFSETLSRVLKFPKLLGSKSVQNRHREHIGETPERLQNFRNQMAPVFTKSTELYQLVKKISEAQFEVAKTYSPLYPIYDEEKSFECRRCDRKKNLSTVGEWEGVVFMSCEDWGEPEIVQEVSELEFKRDYGCKKTVFSP